MNASEARAMASRANRSRYSYLNFQDVFLEFIYEDEFDGEGKRLYLTRSKLRTKLKAYPSRSKMRRKIESVHIELREQCEVATRALEDFETEAAKKREARAFIA